MEKPNTSDLVQAYAERVNGNGEDVFDDRELEKYIRMKRDKQ